VEVIEKLEPTIGLEPMTCRLRTDEDSQLSTTQPTSDDVTPPAFDRRPEVDERPSSSQFVPLGDQLVTSQRGHLRSTRSRPCHEMIGSWPTTQEDRRQTPVLAPQGGSLTLNDAARRLFVTLVGDGAHSSGRVVR
jgi:hypothetical protein